ncbi:MAG: hypothetical protein JWR55_1094 [Aeromicrobium sp.]|jgi:hypothetical protein|nr:hypothetical protein [Aeromicrobium sp.]
MLSFLSGLSLPAVITGFAVPAVVGVIVATVTNVALVNSTTGAPSGDDNPANQAIIVYGAR